MSIRLSAYEALNNSMVQIIVNQLEWGYLNWGSKPLIARVPGRYSTGWYILCVTDVYFNLEINLEHDSYVSVQNDALQLVITPPSIAEQFYFTYDTAPIDLFQMSWGEFAQKPLFIRSRANDQIISYIPTTDKYSYNYLSTIPNSIPSNVIIRFLEPNYIKRAWDSFTVDSSLVAGCCMMAYEDQTGSSMMYKKFCQTLGMYTNIGNAKCDTYMNEYCPVNLDSPYCGCYTVDDEIKKLSPEMQTYSAELKARPDCWLKSCKTGYNNNRSTEVCPIMNCLRLNTDPDVYQIDGRAACYYGLDPIKTPKYVSPPVGQIIDQTNSSDIPDTSNIPNINQINNPTNNQTADQSNQSNQSTTNQSTTNQSAANQSAANQSTANQSSTSTIKTFLTNPFIILLFLLVLIIAINSRSKVEYYPSVRIAPI